VLARVLAPGRRARDTLDIILNLRKLVFTLHVNRPKLIA